MMPRLILALLACLMAFSSPAQAGCSEGKVLFEQARKARDTQTRIDLLRQSLIECRTFAATYELGAVLAKAGQSGEAEKAFRDAGVMAQNERELAMAKSGLGQVFLEQDRKAEAISCLRESQNLFPNPNTQDLLKKVEQEQARRVVKAEEIVRAFSVEPIVAGTAASAAIAGSSIPVGGQVQPPISIAPSMNFQQINFEFDSADLTEKGQVQADELGRALTNKALAGKHFLIIGHTDEQGPTDYNQRLSEQRAATVSQYLRSKFELGADRLWTEGRGESEPLYPGHAEEDYALNRRVEVRLERP